MPGNGAVPAQVKVHIEVVMPTKELDDATPDEMGDFLLDELKRLFPTGSTISIQVILDNAN